MVDKKIINSLREEKSNISGKNIKKLKVKSSSAEMPKKISLEKDKKKIITKKTEKIGVFRKIGKALAHPSELFERTKSEGIESALKYYFVIGIFSLIWILALVFLFIYLSSVMADSFESISGINVSLMSAGLTMNSILIAIIFGIVLVFVICPILLLIYSGILHLFIKLFKGQGNYIKTFNAEVYSLTPTMLFGFIPLAAIWSFIISLYGLSVYHDISKLKVFLAMLVMSVLFTFVPLLIILLLNYIMI